jgi:phenylalanine-4-hydroxylase
VSYHPFAFDSEGSRRPPQATIDKRKLKKAVEDLQITWVNYKWHKLNLHWWTVWNGLMGTLDNPKIYGAGLLFPHWRMVYVCWMKYKTPLFH